MSNPIEYKVKVWENGNKEWYLNDLLHRIDGPAIEWRNGNKEWYLYSKLHREDGPAIENFNGTKEWWLNGKEYVEKEYNLEINKRKQPKVVELTVADIEKLLGKKVKIIK
jgi:hypothetical protein